MSTAAFDRIARSYDQAFTETAIGRLQRDAVWRYLEARVLAGGPKSILELGAGTGEDAIHLAALGHRVTATDASAAMIAVAGEKIAAAGRSEIRCVTLDLRDLGERRPAGRFDLVFSNFGGLNCLSPAELERFAGDVAATLEPGGRAVLVVISACSLWETVFFACRGRLREAMRRARRGPVEARLGTMTVPIWYHRTKHLIRPFRPWFDHRATRPIGVAVPPSYLQATLGRWPRLLQGLGRIDRLLGRVPLLAHVADHVLVDLERLRDAAPPAGLPAGTAR